MPPPVYAPKSDSTPIQQERPVVKLQVGAVLEYIKREYASEVTRQTVYNWIKLGKNGVFLPADAIKGCDPITRGSNYVTTTEHVDAFLASLGVQQVNTRPVQRLPEPGRPPGYLGTPHRVPVGS